MALIKEWHAMEKVPVPISLETYTEYGAYGGECESPIVIWEISFDDHNPHPVVSWMSGHEQIIDGSAKLIRPAKWVVRLMARGTIEALKTRLRQHGLYLCGFESETVSRATFDTMRGYPTDMMTFDTFDAFIEDWEQRMGQQDVPRGAETEGS